LIKKIANPSSLVILLTAIIIGLTICNIKPWKNAEKGKSLIDWDITSYYGYLPATFIHKDISLSFTENDSINYSGKHQFWPKTAPNGNKVFKFTMGMSYLYSPFFLIAHSYASLSPKFDANGFSKPYEFFLSFSGLFYLIIGLFFLRKVLRMFFTEWNTALVLLLTVLGTNLFYYTTSEPCMSHVYSFSLIAIFIYLSIRWHKSQSLKYIIAIGLISGIVVLIRPVNLLIFIFPLLYGVKNPKTFKNNLMLFISNWKQLVILATIAFLVILPQLIYWKTYTDSWIFNSYIDEHFYFSTPQVLDFLFSYRKGWLLYTPIMIFGCIGLLVTFRKNKLVFYPLTLLAIINIYVLSSWWCWWFGGSFGMRPMIDTYGFFAIPLGYFFQWIWNKKIVYKAISLVAICCMLGLNLFQTQQRRNLVIHWDSMSKESYWYNFTTLKFSAKKDWEIQESLLKHPDYKKALKGEDEYNFSP
jgi:hypothetical protein